MNIWLLISGLSGALAVGFGAFGAHALKARLAPDALGWWETAVHYQFFHTFLLLAIGVLVQRGANHGLLNASGWLTLAGIVVFSGSLYAMALGAPRWFGAITPIGGTAWIVAWLLLAAFAWSASQS